MQRWFFLEERKLPKYRPPPKVKEEKQEEITEILSQNWIFSVSVANAEPKTIVFITGNIAELGEWDVNKVVYLEKKEGTFVWSKIIEIPNTCDVLYRYGLGIINSDSNKLIIRKWETSIHPRILKESDLHPSIDVFGKHGGAPEVTRGWLTTETLVQFKFLNNPLKFKNRLSGRPMHIKVTPVKLIFGNDAELEDLSLNSDKADNDTLGSCIIEVSTINKNQSLCVLKPQKQFGREYHPDDILIVNMLVADCKALAYLVDFYSFSKHASPESSPYHVGFTYVLPNMFKSSEGLLQLPVTCNVKNRPLGIIDIEYLIIYPMQEDINTLEVSYTKYWSQKMIGLEVGHRGIGASFKTKGKTIRENTIASLKKATANGAALLEFDVQLSKDLVPLIYHDYYICISLKRKREIERLELLELPVKDLTLEQLQKLRVYHLVECRNHGPVVLDEDTDENQPFPTLEHAFEAIKENVGFNIELKWTMEMKDGTFELENPFDMNLYVDKVLETVLKHAGERRIIFSCFHPDICTMVRNKQNKYPVMFLTVGISDKYESYRDPRCLSIPAAVQCAVSADILGIGVHSEDLLRDPTQVQLATNAGLVIFCWGDVNNDKDAIKRLKELGLHAVIYDRQDQHPTKKVKVAVSTPESIFLVETTDSQRELIKMVAHGTLPESDNLTEQSIEEDKPETTRVYLDLKNVRHVIGDTSTATSLESLASSMDLREEYAQYKRDKELKEAIDKEAQLKQEVNIFKDAFPECCSTRRHH